MDKSAQNGVGETSQSISASPTKEAKLEIQAYYVVLDGIYSFITASPVILKLKSCEVMAFSDFELAKRRLCSYLEQSMMAYRVALEASKTLEKKDI